MPTAEQLQQMAAWLAGTDIGLLELRTPQGTVRLGRNGAATSEIVPLDESEHGEEPAPAVAASEGVGVFLHAHPLHDAPVVRIGERVAAGQTLGLLQVGPLLLPVSAPVAARVAGVCLETCRIAEYGTALFDLHTD